MPKDTKKPPIHNGKPITAFFARSNKGSPSNSQDASRPTAKQPLTKAASNTGSAMVDSDVPLLQSSLLTLKSPSVSIVACGTAEAPNTPRNSERSSPLTSLVSPSSVLEKRSRSSEIRLSQMPPLTSPGNAFRGGSEQLKCGLDGDSNHTVMFSTPNPKSKKRARLGSKEPKLSDIAGCVPSSQSSEEELTLRRYEEDAYRPTTITQMMVSGDKHNNISMEIDDVEGFRITSQGRSQLSDLMLTPPPSDLPSVPPTPVALDAASKTAKIIADIKAKAYAQITSSPEPTPLEFTDISDSSSDEEGFLPTLPSNATLPSRTSVNQDTGLSIGTRRSTRNILKAQSPSPTESSRPYTTSNRTALKALPSAPPNRLKQTKKASVADPFATLLKEKRLSQRNGNGGDAFNRAEIRTHSNGQDNLVDEVAEEESDEHAKQNEEDIALAITQNSELFEFEDEDVHTRRIKGHDAVSNDEDCLRKTLFGGGRAIRNILEQDKALKRHDKSSEKVTGIRLWASLLNTPDTMTMDALLIEDQRLPGFSTFVRLFNSLIQRGDRNRAGLLLNADFISCLDVNERAAVVAKLYDLAFSLSPSDALSGGSVRALEEFWTSRTEPVESSISFCQIVATMQSLGADTTIILENGWPVINAAHGASINAMPFREPLIQKILILINACAKSERLHIEDIPNIILALALIGMDMTTSPELWRDIIATVNFVCQTITKITLNNVQLEILVCSKLLQSAAAFDPVNKAHLVYLLSSASGPARRIATMSAYCIITDKQSPEHEMFSDTPPLREIIDKLSPYSKWGTSFPGKFALYDKTDYINLGFYITILGTALSSLRNYVVQERQLSTSRNFASFSPRNRGEKIKTDLQHLYAALETLHSNISDTRATHLDRSRTKENIKGLAMNVHYQREHWLKNLPDSRAKTLAEYFVTKPKP